LWATRTAERDEGLGGVLEALPLRLHDAEPSLLVGALGGEQ